MKAQHKIQQAIITAVACFLIHFADAQTCTPKGNQAVYGTGNTWIGYVYRGSNFDVYKGYVNEGSASSADFDESFGGSQVQYATNGCSVYTDTFSVRYRLTRSFLAGDYIITVGGDDGYRFSIDGGATWSINNWSDHSYATSNATIHLNGTYNLVLEYYERYVDNRISIKIEAPCGNGENTALYNTSGWTGYVYSGMNFDSYKGSYIEQSNFDQNFGGDNVTFNTSGCAINTNAFSVRYRMNRTLAAGTYIFTVGGDDGYRCG